MTVYNNITNHNKLYSIFDKKCSNYKPIINNKSWLILGLNNSVQAVYCVVPLKGCEYHNTVGHIT